MLRDEFHLPAAPDGAPALYFCGNSLGLQPKGVEEQLSRELRVWREHGVEGWWGGEAGGWLSYHRRLQRDLSAIVGAKPDEVVACNALTVNLHLLLVSFFRPTGRRCKIIMESGAFPSDQHAVRAQLQFHGLDLDRDLIEVAPRRGSATIRTEDIIEQIERAGDELALVLWSGVQYYTGQFFDLPAIATAGRKVGARVGFDLAHAAGNVPLQLHEWGCDFAVWCNYKYLNGGPGAPGGLFVHERHEQDDSLPRLAGWWGHRESDRFQMKPEFVPERGAAGWQVSTAPVLGLAPLLAGLPLFSRAGGMEAVRKQSELLTDQLYRNLQAIRGLRILTPERSADRGAQISAYLPGHRPDLEKQLSRRGLICDYRQDNLDGSGGGVLRLAPAPLYNTLEEVNRIDEVLRSTLALN
ncbi:kynureninase [Neolewinella xylanilytica]|uniref:Kynureninase n=1 Tax=Neolewinella xylanilytica TaxID=1514080 RepID=A0A2S6I2A9_9BACT|nr:kynureninase [Neolewinella xylanilytica]PPK85314.1 kynureninase [Neolewinella xylanilytica]